MRLNVFFLLSKISRRFQVWLLIDHKFLIYPAVSPFDKNPALFSMQINPENWVLVTRERDSEFLIFMRIIFK
jgi:hypothetical protein